MTKLLKTGRVCLSLQGYNPSEEIHKEVVGFFPQD